MDSSEDKKKMTPALKLTIVFLCIVAFLTFYSKTMYNAGIPTVHVTGVKSEQLRFEYSGEGVVVPEETTALYAPDDLIITEVLVRQYDKVEEGDLLAAFDVSGLENQLKDLDTAKQKLIAARDGTWDEGERKLIELDISDTERHMKTLRTQIENGRELSAPFTGTIIKVNAQQGMMANRSAPLFELTGEDQAFVIKHVIPEDMAKYFNTAKVDLVGTIHRINGKITSRAPAAGGGIEITIELEPGRIPLKPDMLALFELVHVTERLPALVPVSAIFDGTYIYKLIETEGPLGTEYRVNRIEVKVDIKASGWAGVTGDVRKGDMVVVSSDRPLSDERVKLYMGE